VSKAKLTNHENDLQRKQTEGRFISEMEGDLNEAINRAVLHSSLRIWFYYECWQWSFFPYKNI